MPRTSTAQPKKKRGQNALKMGETIQTLRKEAVDASTHQSAALVDPTKPLTQKQRDFVRYWAQGETILSASYRAGYNDGGTYAYRIARMPHILALYEQEKKAYEEASNMSRKRVVDGILEAIDMAKMINEPGNMISGWREIAKMCGYYAPVEKKVTIDHNGSPLMQRLNQLSDAELLKMIQDDAAGVIDVEATEIGDGDE